MGTTRLGLVNTAHPYHIISDASNGRKIYKKKIKGSKMAHHGCNAA